MEDFSNIGNPKAMIKRHKDEYIQVAMSSRTTETSSIPDLSISRESTVIKSVQKTENDIQQESKEKEEQISSGTVTKGTEAQKTENDIQQENKEKEQKISTGKAAKFVSFSQPIIQRKTTSTLTVPRRQAISEFEIIKSQKFLIFGGIDPYCAVPAENHGKEVFQYDLYLNHWERFASMPGARHHHSAVVFHGQVFMIGGTRPAHRNLKSTLAKSMWSFDVKKLEWTNEKPLPFPRRDFGLVATPIGLHVIGGENCAKTLLSSHLFYDAFKRKWTPKNPLKTARSGIACAVLGFQIWAAGGIIDNQGGGVITDTVECYDIKEDAWTEIHHLRIPRCFGKFCVLNKSNIYIVGGVTLDTNKKFTSMSSIDKYFYEFREWKEVTEMSNARHGHDVVGIADKIFIFGGISTELNATLDSVECLWTENMSWIKGMSPMPIPVSGLAAVVVNE